MKVVKVTVPGGRTALGLWEDERIVPLSLTGGQFQSLAEIFEADNPAATIDFLADRTRGDIGRGARPERSDDPDWLDRIILRGGRQCDEHSDKQTDELHGPTLCTTKC